MSFGEHLIKGMWKIVGHSDRKRIAHQTLPKNVEIVKDIVYGESQEFNTLDIYYPSGASEPLPIIIDVHGGGWVYGNKELNQKYCMNLAKRGFAVVNINYTLTHIKPFPQAIKDIFSAFNWLEKRGSDYFCDTSKVFLTGDSAGGHLVSISTAILQSQEQKELFGVDTDIKIKAVGLVCGIFELDRMLALKLPLIGCYTRLLLGLNHKNSPYKKYISLTSVMTELPPIFIITSKQDFVKKQSFSLAKKLESSGHNYIFNYSESKKSLPHVFNILYPDWSESKKANNAMCDFFMENINY